jgi:predicted TIM-barrel fold metal-dependent hydrolase
VAATEEALQSAGLGTADRAAVFGANARRLYRLA